MEWEGQEIKKKIIKVLITAVIGLTALFFWQWFKFDDDRLHLIFCDVGQGDAILIRKNTVEILIDAGPDQKVLDCLGKHLPFWDQELEIVVLSHPQADHLNGLIAVIERYEVGDFVASPVGNSSEGFKTLKKLIEDKQIPVKNLYSGGKISFAGLELFSLWPEESWLMAKVSQEELSQNIYGGPASAGASVGKAVLGAQTSANLNDFSLVFHLKYGQFDALLTGDAGQSVQDEILATLEVPEVEVFKVPHHGSKTGMIDEFLEAASPELTVISVGKNQWGHPTKEVIEQLTHFFQNASFAGAKSSNLEIKILRTDQHGEVEIVSDGKSWRVL